MHAECSASPSRLSAWSPFLCRRQPSARRQRSWAAAAPATPAVLSSPPTTHPTSICRCCALPLSPACSPERGAREGRRPDHQNGRDVGGRQRRRPARRGQGQGQHQPLDRLGACVLTCLVAPRFVLCHVVPPPFFRTCASANCCRSHPLQPSLQQSAPSSSHAFFLLQTPWKMPVDREEVAKGGSGSGREYLEQADQQAGKRRCSCPGGGAVCRGKGCWQGKGRWQGTPAALPPCSATRPCFEQHHAVHAWCCYVGMHPPNAPPIRPGSRQHQFPSACGPAQAHVRKAQSAAKTCELSPGSLQRGLRHWQPPEAR